MIRTERILIPASALSAVEIVVLGSPAHVVRPTELVSALLVVRAVGASADLLIADVVLDLSCAIGIVRAVLIAFSSILHEGGVADLAHIGVLAEELALEAVVIRASRAVGVLQPEAGETPLALGGGTRSAFEAVVCSAVLRPGQKRQGGKQD